MKQINILHTNSFTPNEIAFLFPLYFNKRRLKSYGINLSFFSKKAPKLLEADVLLINSKLFINKWKNKEDIFEFLLSVKNKGLRVIWCDITDSTGTTQFEVLPFVDKYFKAQKLKDSSKYLHSYYGSRIFTDYYHKKFNITDHDPFPEYLSYIPKADQLDKISVHWNSALADYGIWGDRLLGDKIFKLRRFLPIPYTYPYKWYFPQKKRPLLFSCRIGTSYKRNTIAFQRKEVDRIVFQKYEKNKSTKKISRLKYMHELAQSQSVFSPFGFGEICYRDFEIFICGAACIKPEMDHMETWPDLWIKNKTYIPFKWDFSDLDELIFSLEDKKHQMIEIAENAQLKYYKYLCTKEGYNQFCEHFVRILK